MLIKGIATSTTAASPEMHKESNGQQLMKFFAVWQTVTAAVFGSGWLPSGRVEQGMQPVSPSVAAQVATTNSIVVFASQLVACQKTVINSCSYKNNSLLSRKRAHQSLIVLRAP